MKRNLLFISVFILVIACGNKQAPTQVSGEHSATTTQGDSGKVYRTLSPVEFSEQMKTEAGMLIDVRTPGEYNKGFISGATLMDIFSDDFDQKLAQLDRSKTYYVYCAKGGRSEECAEKMKSLGFTRVYDLNGGIVDWKESGLPTEMPKSLTE